MAEELFFVLEGAAVGAVDRFRRDACPAKLNHQRKRHVRVRLGAKVVVQRIAQPRLHKSLRDLRADLKMWQTDARPNGNAEVRRLDMVTF